MGINSTFTYNPFEKINFTFSVIVNYDLYHTFNEL
jgi:hypothetical protein